HDRLYFLRHHPDIGLVAAEIAEAVIAEAIVQMPEQHDVMLQRDVGASATTSAAAAATTAKPTSTAASAAGKRCAAATAATATHAGVRHARTGNTCLATCRLNIGCSSRRYVPDRRVAPALVAGAGSAAAVGCLGAIASLGAVASFGTITCLGAIARLSAVASFGAITGCAVAGPRPIGACAIASTITRAGAVLSGVEHFLAVAATVVHPIRGAGPQ